MLILGAVTWITVKISRAACAGGESTAAVLSHPAAARLLVAAGMRRRRRGQSCPRRWAARRCSRFREPPSAGAAGSANRPLLVQRCVHHAALAGASPAERPPRAGGAGPQPRRHVRPDWGQGRGSGWGRRGAFGGSVGESSFATCDNSPPGSAPRLGWRRWQQQPQKRFCRDHLLPGMPASRPARIRVGTRGDGWAVTAGAGCGRAPPRQNHDPGDEAEGDGDWNVG